ncbi:MAG: tRNA epoxyqueuosine(34) reductase QueG [Planctomycetota bacterium]
MGPASRYALGRDYHNRIGKALVKLGKALAREGLVTSARPRVDAVPLMERSHAVAAGLGSVSKATNLLHPRFGPWFFLGELLLDVEVEADPLPAPHAACGTCTACIDACPTDAFVAPGVLDAGRCISYQTIENRGPIPTELRRSQGNWLFGCDICSEVCPWGRKAPDRSADWGTHPAIETMSLVHWIDPDLDREQARLALEGSPLARIKRDGLARNAALVLGNLPSDEGRIALLRALGGHASDQVREMAAWSLAEGHGQDAGVRTRIEDQARRESDPVLGQAIRRHLDS